MVEKLQHHFWHALLVLALLFAAEGLRLTPSSQAETVTTIQLSIIAAPFSMEYQAHPRTRWHHGEPFFSPGIIKVREHRLALTGWQIVGVQSGLGEQASSVIVDITPIGHSNAAGLQVRGRNIRGGAPFTLVEAPPGHGRGVYEIRPYFSQERLDQFGTYEFTAL